MSSSKDNMSRNRVNSASNPFPFAPLAISPPRLPSKPHTLEQCRKALIVSYAVPSRLDLKVSQLQVTIFMCVRQPLDGAVDVRQPGINGGDIHRNFFARATPPLRQLTSNGERVGPTA